jgi:hypothetical protein
VLVRGDPCRATAELSVATMLPKALQPVTKKNIFKMKIPAGAGIDV